MLRPTGHVVELIERLRSWRQARQAMELDCANLNIAITYMEEYLQLLTNINEALEKNKDKKYEVQTEIEEPVLSREYIVDMLGVCIDIRETSTEQDKDNSYHNNEGWIEALEWVLVPTDIR